VEDHLDRMRAELSALKITLPPKYPFLHAFRDSTKPANARVAIRGDQNNLGEEAPRRFPQILSEGEPKPFTTGSGRLELATAIANSANPLTARVLVNRVWHLHFGKASYAARAISVRLVNGPHIPSCWIIWRRGSLKTAGP
jgi:hypothetical protein